MDSWRRFWRLSRQEKLWFLQASVWLPLTALGIREMGLRRWMSLLERIGPASFPLSSPPEHLPEMTARMVAAAARRNPFSVNCLPRSVVLWWFFRRGGRDAILRLGGRKEGELLEGHAWVELGGKAFDVSEADPAGFVPFDRPIVSGEEKSS